MKCKECGKEFNCNASCGLYYEQRQCLCPNCWIKKGRKELCNCLKVEQPFAKEKVNFT